MDKDKIILNMSGAATRIGTLAAHASNVIARHGIKPNVISGVSSGALLALPIYLGKWKEIEEFVTTFTSKDIFDREPNPLSLRGIWRMLTGKSSFGTQNNLKEIIKKTVSEKEFNRFKKDYQNFLIEIYVGVVNMNANDFELINLGECTYNEYIEAVFTSASIPVAVEPVIRNGEYYYDGGIMFHICSFSMIEKFKDRIKGIISIYSRPNALGRNDNFNAIDVTQVASCAYELGMFALSKKDEIIERSFCELTNTPLLQMHSIKIMKSIYDTDPIRLLEQYYTILDTDYYSEQLLQFKTNIQ